VRAALLDRQRQMAKPPGLVADGRDMGTVVFPEAPLKIFLTASGGRACQRRQEQLLAKGQSVNLARLLGTIEERDARDRNRSDSPLVPADDAAGDRQHGDFGRRRARPERWMQPGSAIARLMPWRAVRSACAVPVDSVPVRVRDRQVR
jgi:hypothetical protein